MNLSTLFYNCLHIKYTHVENSADFAVRREGDVLYIYLEGSNGLTDWKNNFDFPAKPYKRMGRVVWFAHRGFLKVWKSLEGYIKTYIGDTGLSKIVTVGFSHGAALAVLCHEYIWYNRPDLRDTIEGYGFGCPRVIWGIKGRCTRVRWERFMVVKNIDDIVTHVPPCFFGYFHVGEMKKVGRRGNYSMIDAHRPQNYMTELLKEDSAF